jgi:hypothetical protein
MRHLSSQTGSNSNSAPSSEAGGFGDSFTGKDYYQDLINLANTVPLVKIFARYKIYCNESNYMIRCPFKSHKSGRENSGSFKYYHETNSFHCFGCRIGGSFAHASHFVAAMEGAPLHKAAQKIIDLFKNELGDIDDDSLVSVDYNERLKIMLDFSDTVREFHQTYATDEARVYVEGACWVYDTLNFKFDKKLCNEGLRLIVEKTKDYIQSYKG